MRLAFALVVLLLSLSPLSAEPVRFAVMGDLPYRDGHMERFDRLIERINQEGPAFSIHVGDIKGGGTPCSDHAFQAIHDRFMAFDGALFYTPGDNEWTDCHRRAAGSHDPLERLARLRSLFFTAARSLGRSPMTYRRQADEGEHRQMVENAIWTAGDVLFATVHVVGSNNGFERTAASKAEWELRESANKDWIKAAFSAANSGGFGAVVVAIHANPAFESKKARKSSSSGFKRTLKALAKRSGKFDGPVLIVHGDHHRLIIDRPLIDKDGDPVPNVTRLQVMGDHDVGAVFVTVDPAAEEPFRFEPVVMD